MAKKYISRRQSSDATIGIGVNICIFSYGSHHHKDAILKMFYVKDRRFFLSYQLMRTISLTVLLQKVLLKACLFLLFSSSQHYLSIYLSIYTQHKFRCFYILLTSKISAWNNVVHHYRYFSLNTVTDPGVVKLLGGEQNKMNFESFVRLKLHLRCFNRAEYLRFELLVLLQE